MPPPSMTLNIVIITLQSLLRMGYCHQSTWHVRVRTYIQNILRFLFFGIIMLGGGDNMVIFKNHSCNPLDHCSYTTEV